MRYKKIHHISIKLFATFALLFATVHTAMAQSGYWDNYKASGYASGSGTQADPYIIKTAEQLAYFAAQVTASKDLTAYVELDENINLADHWWKPIGPTGGAKPSGFKGHFDGKGYTISSLRGNWGSEENHGFFSFINGGSVKNIIFNNAYLTNISGNIGNNNNARRVGVLAAGTNNSPVIENIIVKNSKIDITKECNQKGTWFLVGGLVGGSYSTPKYANIYVDVDIDLSKVVSYTSDALVRSWYGGLLGAADGGTPSIQNAYVAGHLEVGKDVGIKTTGTIVGSYGNTNSSTVLKGNCYYEHEPTCNGVAASTGNIDGTLSESYTSDILSIFNQYKTNRTDLETWKNNKTGLNFGKFVVTVTEIYTTKSKNTTFTASEFDETGAQITWSVEGTDITPDAGTSDTQITIPLYNKERKGIVSVTIDGITVKSSFTISPKYYSTDLYADSYAGGTGTKNDPYLISNDLELAKLAREVNNSNAESTSTSDLPYYSGTYFKLTQDIDLSSALWLPIGKWNNIKMRYFAGKLDGDGHTISNMHIYWEDVKGNNIWAAWGLFARIQGTAADENSFSSVRNLIMENALVEKLPHFIPVGTGISIGVVTGEVCKNGELSNVIIRHSQMTDNDETYSTTATEYRVGGIVGNLECGNSDVLRVYNLSADTQIKMFKNANVNGKAVYMGAGVGRSLMVSNTNTYHIYPTNIYVYGDAVSTKTGTSYHIGGVMGYSRTAPTASQHATWYYTNAPADNLSTQQNNYGSQKGLEDFKSTFCQQSNTYLQNKIQDTSHLWVYSSKKNGFDFGRTTLTVDRIQEDIITANTPGENGEEKYYWYTSVDKINWTLVKDGDNPLLSHTLTLPYKEYDQYIYAILEDRSSCSNFAKVEALKFSVILDSKTTPGTSTVKISNTIWDSNERFSISYEWQKNGKTVGTDASYNVGETTTSDKIGCHIIIKDKNGNELVNRWIYTTTVVYLNPTDTENPDKDEAARTEDSSWGYEPQKPMLTWKGAYSKLEEKASWDENYIVLMGTSSMDVTNNTTTGFNIGGNDNNGIIQNEKWEAAKSSPMYRRSATITGEWDGNDYNGVIEMAGDNKDLPLWGDTRFQNITFNHKQKDYDIIYCQYNNLEMGEGVKMKNYPYSPGYGTLDGALTTSVQIFGGFNNDARFVPLNSAEQIKAMEEAMPHGKDGFSITLKSGFYSCICVGGRQSTGTNQNGVMGTPNMPIKCTITMDINRAYNDLHNKTFGNNNTPDYDAGIILAGNHEGAMYGDVDIIIKSGKVARVVNGTLGNQHNFWFSYNNKTYNAPCNSYMGRANILLDPASSEYAQTGESQETINKRVVVTELYGGSTGRGFQAGTTVDNPFYGYSTVTINGGTFTILPEKNSQKANIFSGIYGAGAGGMNGIGNDSIHTPDERIPYWNADKNVMLYGDYGTAKNNLIKYHCYNADTQTYTDVDPTQTNTQIIIRGGEFGSESQPIDGIYAGGSGYMSKGLWTNAKAIPNKNGGNVYGKTGKTVASLTIEGGSFYCSNGIFAGGRGTDKYFATKAVTGGKRSDYQELGKTYGNVELTINGGTFHCPIFGGGYGVADAKEADSTQVTTLTNMARLYGKSTVTINGGTFYKNIYGGGDMAVVEYKGEENEAATNVIIAGRADIRGSIFAGGNGRPYRVASNTTINNDTQHPELVGKVEGNTNVTFMGNSKVAPYIYGDIYGGGNLAQVGGDTYINLYAANFAGQIFGGGKGQLWTDSEKNSYTFSDTEDKTVRNSADVSGNTHVTLAQDQGIQYDREEEGENEDLFSINVIWNRLWDASENLFYVWSSDVSKDIKVNKDKFFYNGKFLNPHNIYGGGNLACKVTGKTLLTIQKGMTPYSLLTTQEWKASYTDNKNPHFYVFGGGYGAHTVVGSTDVNVDVEGDYSIYDAEIDDDTDQLARPSSSRKAAKSKVASRKAKSSSTTTPVFDNSKGIPNFTILGVLGGGYSGQVTSNTKVTIDGNTFLHRVYGGGFGDPESTDDNNTGQIGGNTEVYVQGAHTYGDIFGGGAGVAPATATASPFSSIARVKGTTLVKISDDAKIYGNVYGGGDIANVGEYQADKPEGYYSQDSLKSVTTLDQANGSFLKYEAKGYKSFVNIIGGDIYGEVYGGGKGLKKAQTAEYEKVGRINGNTLVHIANTDANTSSSATVQTGKGNISSESTDFYGNTVPYVWNRIYGGCKNGTVDGNTLVHIDGGMIGLNVFGGGYGDVNIEDDMTEDGSGASTDINTLYQVLGKKDEKEEATYANILGNTKVQIDGGTWIWNKKADINGNITTWLDAAAENNKICNGLDDFKQIVYAIQSAKTLDDITLPMAKEAINKIKNSTDTQNFFDINTLSFKKNHNIFGGGNRACNVGTYNTEKTSVEDGTGKSVVILNHSPLADITDSNGNTLSLLDCTTLQGLCWYLGSKEIAHPQFSVFGAGYGANTMVGSAEVYARPGIVLNENGDAPIEMRGFKYRYTGQVYDIAMYTDRENEYYEDFLKVSKEDKKRLYGSSDGGNADGSDDDPNTFIRYRASRMAWSLGTPSFTVQEVHGGGFSGYVLGNTYVETDCQLNCQNIFGAGLGATPYDAIKNTTVSNKDSYDFGSIGGKSKVFIKAANVLDNVYGGGAGIVDYPEIARVKGNSEVHVYGRVINQADISRDNTTNKIDRTLIFGSVYGGGDIANVNQSLVNIRGGKIFSPVFAGGNGRKASVCEDYTLHGSIHGDAKIIIDRPVMQYPYCDVSTGISYDPASEENMAHPADDVNLGIYPYLSNRVYGGCQNGTVDGDTYVEIRAGHYGSNIFGGGWGACDTLSVRSQENISITSADIKGNTHVDITGGEVELTSYWLPEIRAWRPADIINGKTYSPQYNHETLKFRMNHNIYAGGNTACIVGTKETDGKLKNNTGHTYLTMSKGMLFDDTKVVSGENGTDYKFFESDEWKEVYDKTGSPHFCVFGGGYGENTDILGDTHIDVAMATRSTIHDSEFNVKEGEEHKHFVNGYSLMDIIGGGYSGKVEGDTHITGEGGVFCRRVFGGGFYNTVNASHVDIKTIDCHDIFGGGLMGDVLKSTNVNIGTQTRSSDDASSTSTLSGFNNADIYIHGSVYGANDVSGYVNVALDKNGYFVDNGGTGTHINIYGGTIDGNVYGAGNGDYLYALDKKGNSKVTVNEHYPLNPNDPDSEKEPLVYTVPMRSNMPSYKAASDAAKIVNINSWRPTTNKVNILIQGEADSDDKRVIIKGDVYGGGNSATVQQVQKQNVKANKTEGAININIGSHVKIGRVFMGCNGDELFTASEDNDFMNKFQKLNGDVEDYTKELNLADTIDWMGDPSNKAISTLWLSTKNEERPLVYPHLLDLYFQPVETDIQGTLKWNGTETGEGLTDCTIGTFCCGGNRGNMNVYPTDKGNVLEYTFPAGLTITDKIVGGCNNANYDYKGKVSHEGGYLLGAIHSTYPFIKLHIKNNFEPTEYNNAYKGGNVYGGCYKSGTIRGDVTIDIQSDMLKGKSKEKLENSNELIATSSDYSALNVYGAGFGMDSYVYGNTHIVFGDSTECQAPSTMQSATSTTDTSTTTTTFNPSGSSANFVYGGGQQGNVIGKTFVEILNGHLFKSVTGGSYSGYVWGSTQIKVGYPKYYVVKPGYGGVFTLKRTDQNNKDIDKNIADGKQVASETIKQAIRLFSDDVITQSVYDAIAQRHNYETNTDEEVKTDDKPTFFQEVAATTPSVGWNHVNIVIGEAVYGGGYSLAQGSSVMANNTTVLKYTEDYNLDEGFTSAVELGNLKKNLGGTTAGFGGNTTILIGDRTTAPDESASESSSTETTDNRDHITISRQDMKAANVAHGQDLLGYYYKDKDNKYHYIYQAGVYYKGGTIKDGTLPQDMEGEDVYEYDNEGGVFGDGHLSYAEGFRSADLTGYGFASTTISSPKILNTFQRMDVLRLTDNCFSLLGARDYATNAMDKTPYSISRVGEIQMFANNVAMNNNKLGDHNSKQARNYMGFANNIHYVGALYSNVSFNDNWHNKDGVQDSYGTANTYQEVKQKYINDYYGAEGGDASYKDVKNIFEKRNDGTAKNMIGIASGYALKVQNAQEIQDANGVIEENLYYGPIYGVIEMNLIDVREDEGGGYVYADNAHDNNDFLETTGNFVFPYTATQGRYIVDDCFPVGYSSTNTNAEAHYWYVTGFNYHYTAHITGYTLDKSGSNSKEFESNNKDGLVTLSGLKKGQDVHIISWKMYSTHDTDADDSNYQCDLENRNYSDEATDHGGNKLKGKYELYVGASNSLTYVKPTEDGETKPTEPEKLPGFAAKLSMEDKVWKTDTLKNNLPDQLTGGYAKIAFMLKDNVNNSTSEYYNAHLSKPCKGTLVLEAPAFEDETCQTKITGKLALSHLYTRTGEGTNASPYTYTEVNSGKLDANTEYFYRSGETNFYQSLKGNKFYTKQDNSEDFTEVKQEEVTLGDNTQIYYCEIERHYTYTIDLTIEYVQGPDIEGHITIENCALPGERIRVKKDQVVVKADQAFSVNGYYWRIGKRKQNEDGEWVFDTKDDWSKFKTSADFNTYNQSDKEGKGMFAGCYYDKTEDYLEIPAYYYMNGYGIQLGVTMNMSGLNDILPVKMLADDHLTIHNYHRMDPHKSGMNLHLADAIKRAAEDGKDENGNNQFAEPRIYLADQTDLAAFIQFVDTICPKATIIASDGTTQEEELRYGKYAQFVLQNDLTMLTSNHDGSSISDFAGTLHGNGHVIKGLAAGNCLFNSISGNVYNLGLTSGKISNMEAQDGKIGNYHCCFEYAPEEDTSDDEHIVYHMDGTVDKHYTTDDFRLGTVAYDLNEYYLRARYSHETDADKTALKYVYDYVVNGDYQYAYRTDAITGKNTGATYLRTGKDSDLPNYEQAETRHDKTHAIDKARAQNYKAAYTDTETGIKVAESRTGDYLPLFNNAGYGTEKMNDFIFWGQSLQSEPAQYPTTITSQQLNYMANRVYRTAGYYGDTKLSTFHYNAYYQGNSSMGTYVHTPSTTAIDFTCQNDLAKSLGRSGSNDGIFYAPIEDNASVFHDFSIKDGVTQNLLVYTATNNEDVENEAYDVVSKSLSYGEKTKEALIKGHHIFRNASDSNGSSEEANEATFSATLLHLVERTPNNENSEGDASENNNFCVPISFTVSNHAWYTRKPMYYADDAQGAWEGICLPFTVHKAVASLNGEITHFYGKPSADEQNDPALNMHTLHHEYWLRSLESVDQNTATFQRLGLEDDGTKPGVNYLFDNSFFIDTYQNMLYNKVDNPYYAQKHDYKDYPLLTASEPYIVRFPGMRYYEFDLSSQFYNNIIKGSNAAAQTVTFNAYGPASTERSYGIVTIPVTSNMETTKDSYIHHGTFAATEVATGSVYGMNDKGTAFDDASSLSTVMPFRTYMMKETTQQNARSASTSSSVIYIGETTGIDQINPEVTPGDKEDFSTSDYLIIRPIEGRRVRIESTQAISLNVYSTTGQLYRILDVRPGTATYSGFAPGIYIFGKTKVWVK